MQTLHGVLSLCLTSILAAPALRRGGIPRNGAESHARHILDAACVNPEAGFRR